MRHINHILLLAIFLPFVSQAQDKDEELVKWIPSQRLTWNDYKASPNAKSDAAASTTTYLGIEFHFDQGVFTYSIQCSFSKTKSWGRSKTDFILQHEQGHFDIAEIFARKLNKKMSEYKFDKDNYKTDLKKIYQDITREKEAFQDQYDNETDHSRKKEEQLSWLTKIKDMLEELKAYSNY